MSDHDIENDPSFLENEKMISEIAEFEDFVFMSPADAVLNRVEAGRLPESWDLVIDAIAYGTTGRGGPRDDLQVAFAELLEQLHSSKGHCK